MGLQLRLWLTVVVLVVAGALVLLLGTSALYEKVMTPFEAASGQAINAAEGALIKSGDETVDAVTKASVDEAVRKAVRQGELTPEAEASLLGRAGTQGAPTFAILARADGSIAAHAGTDVKLEGPLSGYPSFADAATGVARDDVRIIDGKPFHIAAAPVYEAGGGLGGVILLGWPYDAAFADRLGQSIGAPVLLTWKGERLGHGLESLTPDQLKMRGQGVGDLDIKPLPNFLPLLMEHGRYTIVSRPLTFGADEVSVVVGNDRNEGFKALAWAQALVMAGTLLITLLQMILILSTIRSVTKPISVIVDHLSQVSQGNTGIGILPEAALSGQFLRLGKQVNMILQQIPSASRPGAPLGSISGTSPLPGTPPGVPTPSLMPANGAKDGSGPALASLGNDSAFDGFPGAAPSMPAAAASRNPAPSQAAPPSGLSGLFDDSAPDPLAAFRVPAKPAQPATPPPQPEQVQQLVDEAEPYEEPPPAAMSPEATVMFQVPQELLNQSAQAGPPSNLPQAPVSEPPPRVPTRPQASHHQDDARTVVAQVPQELLSAAAPRDGMSNADEQHYKDVYDKFVETRVQCGEDTSDLTYDRFVAKLLKNRQQIVEKHKAKSVRFQVYVKEGKAALRALPVRE